MSREALIVNGRRYAFAMNLASGARAFTVTPRSSEPGDPGGMDFREWTPWGVDLNSRKTAQGYLGREYGDGTDGRWDNVDLLGPELGTLDLTTYDARDAHAAFLLGSTFILGGASGRLGGAIVAANADGEAQIRAAGVTYAYITRGNLIAKVRLSNLTLIDSGKTFSATATDILATRAALSTTRQEVNVALGQGKAYETLTEPNVGAVADTWAENASGVTADVFGQAPDRVLALDGRVVRGNIETGTVTMTNPTWNTVGTLSNLEMTFTGYTRDGNISLLGSTIGPLVLNIQTGEFRPLFPEMGASPSTETMRQAGRWFTMGAVLPGRDGVRYSNGLQGESWGVERFLGNSSVVRGYPTGGAGSMKWYVQAVYDEIAGDTWLVAWRPRQAGDPHPHPFSPYVIGHLTGQQCRYVRYVGYANGERTLPAWTSGRGTSMGYMLDGRSSRFIDDSSYRYITAGSTYLAEEYLDGVLADVEAVVFMTNNCTAARTVTPRISIDGGSTYVSLTAVTSNGSQRVLAVSGGAPLATLQGARRIKPRLDYASNVATASPQVISKVRVYFRWRPREVRDFTWTLHLVDQESGQTAVEQKVALEALPTSAPVLVNEDQANDSYYIRVGKVTLLRETALGGGNIAAGERGSEFEYEVSGTEWAVVA